MKSICHFSRALPATIWGHCSQVLAGFFGTPQYCKTKEMQKWNRPCFTPPRAYHWRRVVAELIREGPDSVLQLLIDSARIRNCNCNRSRRRLCSPSRCDRSVVEFPTRHSAAQIRRLQHPPAKTTCKITSEELQNCSCIKQIIQNIWKAQLHIDKNRRRHRESATAWRKTIVSDSEPKIVTAYRKLFPYWFTVDYMKLRGDGIWIACACASNCKNYPWTTYL